ncbi:MAG: class I SAM-dependent methyltransferase [Actinomycetota bacterium]
MPEAASNEPSIYDSTAEYYDLTSSERVASLRPDVERWASDLPAGLPVIDVGAGTGRLTAVLARAGSSDVHAVEPSFAMRAIMASRLADDEELAHRVTIVSSPTPAAWGRLPEVVGGVMMLGALMHLTPEDRRALLAAIAARLTPMGSAFVELMPPWSPAPVHRQEFAVVRCGRHVIRAETVAEPVGAALDWTMTYRRFDATGSVLDETTSSVRCWPLHPDAFEAETAAAGLTLEWRSETLALLRGR